jgi:hypothetical protein
VRAFIELPPLSRQPLQLGNIKGGYGFLCDHWLDSSSIFKVQTKIWIKRVLCGAGRKTNFYNRWEYGWRVVNCGRQKIQSSELLKQINIKHVDSHYTRNMRLAPEQTSFAEKKNWRSFALGVIEAVVPRGRTTDGTGRLGASSRSVGTSVTMVPVCSLFLYFTPTDYIQN